MKRKSSTSDAKAEASPPQIDPHTPETSASPGLGESNVGDSTADRKPRRKRTTRTTNVGRDVTVSPEASRDASPNTSRSGPAEAPEVTPSHRQSWSDDAERPGFQLSDVAELPQAAARKSAGPPAHRALRPLDESRIDPDVQKVIRRLTRAGYEAYLVGGCVRELLLDRTPKDVDGATSARPEEVRSLFRNSRIIGRRFRLVHVLFHAGKVIEVATFRRNPGSTDEEGDTAVIRSDNVFGEAHEDALRRDFTINALFYDLDRREILDWVGGLPDLELRLVNTIGDPVVRFREDPVRMLRALKFAGRLDLGISPHVYDALVFCRDALDLAARARVAEEVLRLMRGGRARRTIYLAWETGILDILLPELAAILYDSFSHEGDPAKSAAHRVFRLLEFIDQRAEKGIVLDDAALWTILLLEPLKEATDGSSDRGGAAFDLLEPMMDHLAIPRRFSDSMRRILTALPRIHAGKASRFSKSELYNVALDVADADLYARGLKRPAAPARERDQG